MAKLETYTRLHDPYTGVWELQRSPHPLAQVFLHGIYLAENLAHRILCIGGYKRGWVNKVEFFTALASEKLQWWKVHK